MSTTTRHIIFWSIPLSALFIVLRAHIVRVLLGTGAFDWNDTRLTAAALALFVVSAVFQGLILLFMRAFYSIGETKKPFFITFFSTGVLLISSYALVQLFLTSSTFRLFTEALLRVEDLPGTAVLMLPLGFSIGMIVNGVILWIAFERRFRGFTRSILKTLFNAFSASVLMASSAYTGLWIFAPLFDTASLLGIFLQGFFAGMMGILTGIILLWLLGSRELDEVWRAVHRKFWRTKVIATDPEIV